MREENYKNLINNVNDLVCEVNDQGYYTFVNNKYEEILGYKPAELIGKSAIDLMHPDDVQPSIAKYSNLIKSKEQSVDIWRFIHKNSQYRIIESKGNVYKNSKGEIRVVVISRDITEKINAENLLKESEEKYRLLVEMSPDAIVVYQNDRFVFCNRAALKIFGAIRNSELLGTNFYDRVHTDFQEFVRQRIYNILHRKENVPLAEIKFLKLDGSPIDVEVIGTIFMHDGKPAVQVLIRDISAKLKSEKLVREIEERYRTAFKISPDAVNINKLDGTYVDINEGFTVLTGYTEEDVLGISSVNLNIWAKPEDREKLIKGLKESGKVENLESVFRRKDGSLTTALMSARIISIDDEPHILSITRDISARKVMENELVRAKEKAEESDRLKTAFLQNMSHEIRTPMNAIIGFSSLLPNNFGNKEKLTHYSEIIYQRSNDLLTIINDLLDISRIESGQLTFVPEEFKLKTIVDEIIEVIEKYKQTIKKQHIKFSANLHSVPDNYTILTDKVKLKQVFTNLIENAFKFTNEGAIELGCRLEKENIEFYVSDTGIGIPEEKQQAVFDRFIQVDAGLSRKHGGTGLGLSIVKGLVQLLNGKIWLESEPGKGSTFFFTIPIASMEIYSQETNLNQSKKITEISDLSILIVEDDPFNAEYLNEILNSHGNIIYKAVYGHQAIEIAEHNKLDVILMDIRLPDVDGYEVTKILKKSKPQLKIIAQTAYATEADEQKSLASGCDAYISKPINKNELFSKILKVVNNV